MSKVHSQPFEKMNELVEGFGPNGLIFLSIFKSLKNNAIQNLSEELENKSITEEEINVTCISIAKDVFKRIDKNPGEDDVKRVLTLLKNDEGL